MRKNTVVLALGLALSLGASEVVLAQSGSTSSQQSERHGGPGRGGERGGRRGGPEAMLLRGITLSADQQKRVEALREQERNEMRARHEQLRGSADEARAPRQRPDSATMRQMRARHEQERERRVSALRNILSADQRRTFDANLAELRQREAQRDSVHRSGDGGRDGRRGEPGASRPQ